MKVRNICAKILALCLSLALLTAGVPVMAAGGRTDYQVTDATSMSQWPQAPSVSAGSAYLIELNSGEVLFAKDADEMRCPASITKILTALIVLENGQLSDSVTLSRSAITITEDNASKWGDKEGDVLTVEQLLYAMMLDSVNEAANALAEYSAGSVGAFAELMNTRAAALGCTNTHFTNCNGLTDAKHVTTAHDMALIMWAAVQNPEFVRIASTTSYKTGPTVKTPSGYSFSMHHKMLLSSSEYYYADAVAGKTGYITASGNTLVTYAKRGDVELVAVVLKDTSAANSYIDTKAMFEYGFNKFTLTDLSAASENYCQSQASAYPGGLSITGSTLVMLPNGVTDVSMKLDLNPASSGETEGRLLYQCGNVTVGSAAVKAAAAGSGTSSGKAAGSQEAQTPDSQTAADQDNSRAKSPLFWVAVVLIAAAVLLVVYWCVVQTIKSRRRRRRTRNRYRSYSRGNKYR